MDLDEGTTMVEKENGEPATGQFSYSHTRLDMTYTVNCCA